MDTSVVKLEIDMRWWYWRGYGQQLHAESYLIPSREVTKHLRRYQNLIDGGEYDVPSAFPNMKPDINIFGVPGRTRTQRGWYQVKPWPPRPSIPLNSEGKGLTSPSLTAADIPPELFDCVLDSAELQLGGDIGSTKQELTRLSLVCRYWNDKVQPRIYKHITIRNRADVDTLHATVATSPRPLANAIHTIKLSLPIKKYPYHPWIHLFTWSRVLDMIGQPIPVRLSVVVDIEGPLPSRRFMKGIHDLLPSRLPSMSLGITHLQMSNVRFKAFSALLQLFRELPTVKDAVLTAVDWECSPAEYIAAPALYYFPRTPQHRSYNVTYRFQRSTNNSAATWLGTLLPWDKAERLEQKDADTVCLVGTALAQHVDANMYPDWCMRSARFIRADPIEFVAESKSGYKYITPFMQIHYQKRRPEERCLVYAITCNYLSNFSDALPLSETIGHTNWSIIDALAVSFPTLRAFVIAFKSPEDVLFFHNEVASPKMPLLSASRVFKYTVYSHDTRRGSAWTEVTCVDGAVRNTGRVEHGLSYYVWS